MSAGASGEVLDAAGGAISLGGSGGDTGGDASVGGTSGVGGSGASGPLCKHAKIRRQPSELLAACGVATARMPAVPNDVLFVIDRSIALLHTVSGSKTLSRWGAIYDQMNVFVTSHDPSMRVGMVYYGRSGADDDELDCDASLYAEPDVELGPLSESRARAEPPQRQVLLRGRREPGPLASARPSVLRSAHHGWLLPGQSELADARHPLPLHLCRRRPRLVRGASRLRDAIGVLMGDRA
jgi:hypothetical protein